MTTLLVLSSSVLLWFGGTTEDPPRRPPDSHRMAQGQAPTPFSAKQIEATCVAGHWVKHKLEFHGQDPRYQTTKFLAQEGERAEFEVTTLDLDGKPTGDPRRGSAGWEELQAHASFPASNTEIRSAPVETPAGEFDAWLYIVRSESEGSEDEKRFWFAKRLPGPPVLFEHRRGGEIVLRMTLVARGREEPAPRSQPRTQPSEP